MDMFKPEMYMPMNSYDPSYFTLLEDLSGGQHIFASDASGPSAVAPGQFDLPWLTSDSASTSEEPSSPLSIAGMSPMSPSASDEESSVDASVPFAEPAQALGDHANLKKRARDDLMLSTDLPMPAAKHQKLGEVPEAVLVLAPTIAAPNAAVPTAEGMQSFLAHQYSWNQMQIQQVLACLNATQIQQALSLASQPASAEFALSQSSAAAPQPQAFDFGLPAYLAQPSAPAAAVVMTTGPVKKVAPKKKASASASSSPSSSANASKKRPKLDPKKDALQCLGHNRKKNKQCGNAALMEFIGPRPRYCAEHIDQDPGSLYTKCCSTHHKLNGEGKGCREVVLKEFGFCHKHFDQISTQWHLTPAGLATARTTLGRVSEILEILEAEAAAAKKTDPDLFQRKHKIIPKFVQLVRHIEQWILDARAAGVTAVAAAPL